MNYEKILSAGCSFIQGNELGDEFPFSQQTYPALLAKHFQCAYDSVAYAGASNQGITKKLFDYKDYRNTLVIVQWTFPSRLGVNLSYTYKDKNQKSQQWFDLSPNNWDLLDVFEVSKSYTQELKDLSIDELTKQVYKHCGNDKHYDFNSKLCMEATENFFRKNNIPYVFFSATSFLNHDNNFEGLGFSEWCEKNNFAKGKYHHPLHEAHHSAFEYILDKKIIV